MKGVGGGRTIRLAGNVPGNPERGIETASRNISPGPSKTSLGLGRPDPYIGPYSVFRRRMSAITQTYPTPPNCNQNRENCGAPFHCEFRCFAGVEQRITAQGSFSAGGLCSGSRKVGMFRYTNVLNLVNRLLLIGNS